ncbi:hypothetical protein F8388_011430 [Cannabis sativa]|uniref:LisH domain-containing protein n=1 Tax=Cannabis sativa TaxID=3483 RepID=A0A7J6EVZ2_CANSA|nr:hypothetical protein F8388_011430 [Cannabis sativa]
MANDFDSDPKKQFDIYIHDYLVKKNLPHVAEIFRKEAKMSVDTSKVFLLDWWRSFYEYFGPNLEGIRQGLSRRRIQLGIQQQENSDNNNNNNNNYNYNNNNNNYNYNNNNNNNNNDDIDFDFFKNDEMNFDLKIGEDLSIFFPFCSEELFKKSTNDHHHQVNGHIPIMPQQKNQKETFQNNVNNLGAITTTTHHSDSFVLSGCLSLPETKFLCCQFSSNGKYLATAGHSKKIFVWDPNQLLSNLFVGHSKAVHSLDFKSNNTLFSCDNTNQITQWDLTQSTSYVSNVMRTASHIRIQPNHGKLLAFASGNEVGFFNTETREVLFTGKVHEKIVCLVCWDYDGDHIVSVSEDRVQVWSLSKGQCMYQLDSNGDHYQSCTIHPFYRHTWIIGGNKNLKLWNQKAGPKVLKVVAHGGDVTALAESLETNMIASASDDQYR